MEVPDPMPVLKVEFSHGEGWLEFSQGEGWLEFSHGEGWLGPPAPNAPVLKVELLAHQRTDH